MASHALVSEYVTSRSNSTGMVLALKQTPSPMARGEPGGGRAWSADLQRWGRE